MNQSVVCFLRAVVPEALDGGFNRTIFSRILNERLVDYFTPRVNYDPKITADVEAAMNFEFTPWPHFDDTDDNDQNRQAFNDMITDAAFGYPQDKIHKENLVD